MIPRLFWGRASSCFDNGEAAEGWWISLEWLGLMIELTIARRT